jgi:hypothetical protein
MYELFDDYASRIACPLIQLALPFLATHSRKKRPRRESEVDTVRCRASVRQLTRAMVTISQSAP